MCPSNTLWHLLTEGFALAPSSWKAPLPHLTPHSALAPACSSFPLCEWMPLSLEACLPFHQAKPLHLNAALSVHSPWHICQSALLMSSLTSSPELPEGSIFMSVCLSVCLSCSPCIPWNSLVHRGCSAKALLTLSWLGTLCGQIPQ